MTTPSSRLATSWSIAVGPEDAKAFAKYWQKEELPFVGLPDPSHSVLKLYGQEIKLFKLGRMPAQVLIDKAGVARYVHYGHDMTDIPDNAEILALVDEIDDARGRPPRSQDDPSSRSEGPQTVDQGARAQGAATGKEEDGAHGRTRTCGLRFRRPTL